MNRRLLIAAVVAGWVCAYAADPREVWERAVQAKGGRERLHGVHSLAIYMKPAAVNLGGPPANWLCVFPDRYFFYSGARGASQRAIVVDGKADRAAMDVTGMPRNARHLDSYERDQLVLNQVIYLLESAWLQPEPIEMRHNQLVVQAAGRRYKLFLDKSGLPERIVSLPTPSEKHRIQYDYRLQHYGDVEGVMLPMRVASVGRVSQATWDVDYEVNAKYNPKLFERMPDLANGPEPWRMR